MTSIEPSAEILYPYAVEDTLADWGIESLRRIELIGRYSHRSEDAQTPDSWQRFIKAVVLDKGDWSICEHVNVTVRVVCDRGVQQQWTRHRLFSYTIESTRFVNYVKKIGLSFILPRAWKNGSGDNNDWFVRTWEGAMVYAEDLYNQYIQRGARPQEARSILPLSFASTMIATANLRTWRWWFMMRTSREAQQDIRELAIDLLKQFQQVFPILFDDIVPEESQIKAISKGR